MEEECRRKRQTLQRKSSSDCDWNYDIPPIVHEVLRSPGQPLDRQTRENFEPRFGHDFGKVRVHYDAKAMESAQAVDALAYTVRHHIVFGKNRYKPLSADGRELLAHELVHTIQQSAGSGVVPDCRSIVTVETNSVCETQAGNTDREIASASPMSRLFGVIQGSGRPAIQRAVAFRRAQMEDSTSREAQRSIDQVREAMRTMNLSPDAHRTLQTRIEEAEAALSAYRATISSSSLGMTPVLGTTMTGSYADLFIAAAAGLVLLGAWIFGTQASRTPGNRAAAESLAEALRRLSEAARAARPQPAPRPEAPPQEIPAPRPPGEVIPIESHPRFQPRQPSPRPEPQPTQRLGPDIFYVPRPEPRSRPRDPRKECLDTHPYALACEYEVPMEEVVQDFIMRQGYSFESLGNCRGFESHGPGIINECNGAPGETWHCSGSPYYDPISRRSLPGGEVSIFSCLCCRADGTTGFEWRGPHWSPGAS